MVNVIIYLEKNQNANALVEQLLHNKLIANASIDVDNHSLSLIDNKMHSTLKTVVTVQTKSMLFHDIEKFIHDNIHENVPIYSIPIINSNSIFEDYIRNNTKMI